jgi:hypothetical protein
MNSASLALVIFGIFLFILEKAWTNQFVSAETNRTAAIVVKLTENLLGCGHTVWMDNFYNSPELARFLK